MAVVDRSAELRMPTVAVSVRLALVGNEPAPASLYLADRQRHDHSALLEDLATQLDESTTFIPVRAADVVRLIAKHAIAWISVNRREDEAEAEFANTPGPR